MENKLTFFMYERGDIIKYTPKNYRATRVCEILGQKDTMIDNEVMDKIWEIADTLGVDVDYVEENLRDFSIRQDTREEWEEVCLTNRSLVNSI